METQKRRLKKNPHWFSAKHSTNMDLIILSDKISAAATENGDFALGVFLDFSKAFDSVKYNILFKNLSIE